MQGGRSGGGGGEAEERGCVVTLNDSILETHHLTSVHHNGKCAAYIIKNEVQLCIALLE